LILIAQTRPELEGRDTRQRRTGIPVLGTHVIGTQYPIQRASRFHQAEFAFGFQSLEVGWHCHKAGTDQAFHRIIQTGIVLQADEVLEAGVISRKIETMCSGFPA
jgi:hypothetical protein